MLLDRQTERAAIDQVLDEVRNGRSRTLVLLGGPGIGKTTLLHYAADAAQDLQVCSIAGVESEMEFDFAGLHQLLLPFVGGLEDLPGPQRGALGTVFGLATGQASDRFLVGLATLTLLTF